MRQPNRWSCLATSFAILLKVKPEYIFRKVGHDGSEIVDHTVDEPFGRRTFHIQELIDIALELNYSVVPIEFDPHLLINSQVEREYKVFNENKIKDRLKHYLMNYHGVLTGLNEKGNPHAVVWVGHIIDPADGQIKGINCIQIGTFWIFKKIIK